MKCILIVDDNAMVRRSMRRLLESDSIWRVGGEAANGFDAIAKAQQLHPDLIVLDMSMPIMNGFDTARELKKLMPDVPLLMFTALAGADMENEAVKAGVTSIISKQDPAPLVDSMKRLLQPAA